MGELMIKHLKHIGFWDGSGVSNFETELELFDLCPKAAGPSLGNSQALWEHALDFTLSHGSGKVVCLLHDKVRVWEHCPKTPSGSCAESR